ncbi:MAG: FtsQ-type POTRA domain-containing protein [Deltaproteobacteria bacterium]|nr:FtsQ-type POTRA domain-containing protein [Deltaproteobacteria bacterium]
MLRRSGIKAKKNRIRRRFTSMSGDFFAAMGVMLVAVVMTFVFIYVYNFLISRPYFQIKEVSVRGLRELTEKDVLASAGIKPAQNLLAVNTDAVIRRVSANQWVKNVYVGRELPDKLVLEVRERDPLVLVKQGSDFYLMDGEGFVFKKLGKSDEVDLPILTGFNAQDKTKSRLLLGTLDLLKTVSTSSKYSYLGTISEINIDEIFGLSLIFNTGIYLKLGMNGFENKFKQLTMVMADLEKRGIRNGYLCIDLSDESKVTVQRRNAPGIVEHNNKGQHYLI